MAEAAGLFIFFALAVVVGPAIASSITPAFGALLAVVLTLTMVAGVLYVGGVVLGLPVGPLERTRVGRLVSSGRAKTVRRIIALAYWGALIIMAAGLLALGRIAGRH